MKDYNATLLQDEERYITKKNLNTKELMKFLQLLK